MAKTYIDTVKYTIYANFEVNGIVDKPDVVGAIFGQTEGLLGEELDLRDLQKNGRIGRIEVELTSSRNKTIGEIRIPSSLDMVETSIIAAALETVERVGPCDARITVNKIEDNRNAKRKKIIEKAKSLLKEMLETQIPDSREITELVRKEVKAAGVIEYGPEKLPAGPTVSTSDSVIFVEGRADVINLLRNDISNVIAIGGARVPKQIIELSREKEVTVFLDGDRGGDIILNELVTNGVDIDFVARAPKGKEVEELTRKELIKALRNKIPFSQVVGEPDVAHRENHDYHEHHKEDKKKKEKKEEKEQKHKKETKKEKEKPKKQLKKRESPLTEDSIKEELTELRGKLKARFYDKDLNLIEEIPVKDIIKVLSSTNNAIAIVFDGIITQRLTDLAMTRGIKYIGGIRLGNITKKPEGITFITL